MYYYIILYILTLNSELASANDEYSLKVTSGKTPEKTLRKLAWNVDDLSRLNDDSRKMLIELRQIQEVAEGPEATFLAINAPRKLSLLPDKMLTFLQGLYQFRRVAATHIFILMISPEQRDSKPYALPVQCIPYVSLKHSTCRRLVNGLISEMTSRGMKVAGTHVHCTYCTCMCLYTYMYSCACDFRYLHVHVQCMFTQDSLQMENSIL